jgi:hypothetical protein
MAKASAPVVDNPAAVADNRVAAVDIPVEVADNPEGNRPGPELAGNPAEAAAGKVFDRIDSGLEDRAASGIDR